MTTLKQIREVFSNWVSQKRFRLDQNWNSKSFVKFCHFCHIRPSHDHPDASPYDDVIIYTTSKFILRLRVRPKWFISDLIPKKSEKFEFSKNFGIIFFIVRNRSKKLNFEIFRRGNFSKMLKEIQNLRVVNVREKMEISIFLNWIAENCVGGKFQNFVLWASFHAEKYDDKMFRKFGFFGFLKNKVSEKSLKSKVWISFDL